MDSENSFVKSSPDTGEITFDDQALFRIINKLKSLSDSKEKKSPKGTMKITNFTGKQTCRYINFVF